MQRSEYIGVKRVGKLTCYRYTYKIKSGKNRKKKNKYKSAKFCNADIDEAHHSHVYTLYNIPPIVCNSILRHSYMCRSL